MNGPFETPATVSSHGVTLRRVSQQGPTSLNSATNIQAYISSGDLASLQQRL